MKIDIKRAVSENRKVYFQYYMNGNLYYSTEFDEIFEVPIDDTDKAKFLNSDKAILFMRWMVIHNKELG